MTNRKLSKFAAVLALSAALIGLGGNASQAGGPPKQLIGGVLGGVAGAGAGLLLGKEQGAIIGGLMGAALGAIVADRMDSGRSRFPSGEEYGGYIPPAPPRYEPAVVYQPGVYQQPVVYRQQPAEYGRYDRRDRRIGQSSPYPAPSPYPVAYEDYRQHDWR
jgi:hypothetical protein